MTPETMQSAVELLDGWGVQAALEYPGHIAIELWRPNGPGQAIRQHIAFGDANEFFGASITDAEGNDIGSIETAVPSSCEDAEAVARAVYRALFGEDPGKENDVNTRQADEQVIGEKLEQFRKTFQACVDGKDAWDELQSAATDYDAAVDEDPELP
jgi:hypothetical protein